MVVTLHAINRFNGIEDSDLNQTNKFQVNLNIKTHSNNKQLDKKLLLILIRNSKK